MDWRVDLYYPLGILPSVFFTLRFVLQWLESEKQKKSVVSPLFWKLSLTGNLILLLHYMIQIQFPFALLQTGNAVISWRNLDLKKPAAERFSLGAVFALLAVSFAFVGSYFWWEGIWMRIPVTTFQKTAQLSYPLFWNAVGIAGGALFGSRFWVQWWQSERAQRSHLGRTFWSLSIAGSILMLFYFVRIGDHISILNSSFGLIPYVRNLMLVRKSARFQTHGE